MKIEKSKPRRGVVELVSENKRNGAPFTGSFLRVDWVRRAINRITSGWAGEHAIVCKHVC